MENLKNFFSKKKVFITGHTGFKGSWLSQILLTLGSEISGYSLPPATKPNLFSILDLENEMSSYLQDIRDYDKLLSVFKKERPEIVFHLAAQPLVYVGYEDPSYTYSTNVMGTVNLLEAIRHTDFVKAVVVITTDKVYQNKEQNIPYTEEDRLGGYDPYSTSKVCAEHITSSYVSSFFKQKIPIATARAGNVIGGGDWSAYRLVPDIVRSVFESGTKVLIRNPNSVRPWQHVLDPLYGYLLLAQNLYNKNPNAIGSWNFAPNNSDMVPVHLLVDSFLNQFGSDREYDVQSATKHETNLLKLDSTKARKILGWNPQLDINASIKLTSEWYSSFYGKKNIVKLTKKQILDYFQV